VYLAAGRTDGFWEFGLKAWDIAAGALIVNEARGLVTNMDGSDLDLNAANIVASNSRIHDELIEALASARPEAERRHAEQGPAPAPMAGPGAGSVVASGKYR
jgi:myo-inositol-1(or 4)-monophosphatase